MANSRVKAKESILGGGEVSRDWRKLQIILLGSSVHTVQGCYGQKIHMVPTLGRYDTIGRKTRYSM